MERRVRRAYIHRGGKKYVRVERSSRCTLLAGMGQLTGYCEYRIIIIHSYSISIRRRVYRSRGFRY